MSNEKIRDLLTQLRKELDAADVDPATLSLMRELDGDIKGVLETAEGPFDALVNRAKEMEVNFAAKHGGAERILRQLVDTLATMGV
jgi:hypothetical protein